MKMFPDKAFGLMSLLHKQNQQDSQLSAQFLSRVSIDHIQTDFSVQIFLQRLTSKAMIVNSKYYFSIVMRLRRQQRLCRINANLKADKSLDLQSIKMIGGFSPKDVDQAIKDLASNNLAGINAKAGTHYTKVTVDKAWTQVVAGTNYFLWLSGNDGSPAHARIFVPLPHTNAPAQVADAGTGHEEPHHH